jgi:hypothetical protein
VDEVGHRNLYDFFDLLNENHFYWHFLDPININWRFNVDYLFNLDYLVNLDYFFHFLPDDDLYRHLHNAIHIDYLFLLLSDDDFYWYLHNPVDNLFDLLMNEDLNRDLKDSVDRGNRLQSIAHRRNRLQLVGQQQLHWNFSDPVNVDQPFHLHRPFNLHFDVFGYTDVVVYGSVDFHPFLNHAFNRDLKYLDLFLTDLRGLTAQA